MKTIRRNRSTRYKSSKTHSELRALFSFFKSKIAQAPLITSMISAALVASAFFGVFLMVSCHGALPSDASFLGVSLAGMDQKQVDQAVQQQINSKIQQQTLTLSFHQKNLTIQPRDFHFYYDAKKVFRAARAFHFEKGESLQVAIEYDQDAFKNYLTHLQEQEHISAQPYQFQIQGHSLEVQAGTPGAIFDLDQTQADLIEAVKKLSEDPVVAKEQPYYEDCINIDLDAIYQQVHQEERDASFSIDSLGVLTYLPEQTGVDFSLDQARSIVSDPSAGSYVIPVVIAGSKVTVEKLRQQHDHVSCPQVLSSYTTTFGQKDQGRNFNIQKAASSIDGTVLYAGERFSFHDTVGKTGQAEGYQASTIYTPDGLDTGFGGGVCQVCTTAYMASVLANLEIQERHSHSYTVDYASPGLDAAVSDTGPDLKFKNNRSKPIRLSAAVTHNSVTITVYGTHLKEEDYSVTLDPQILETYGYETIHKSNPQFPKGKTQITQPGKNGYRVDTVKTVRRGGVILSTEHIYSRYKPMNQIVEIGSQAAKSTAKILPSFIRNEEIPFIIGIKWAYIGEILQKTTNY